MHVIESVSTMILVSGHGHSAINNLPIYRHKLQIRLVDLIFIENNGFKPRMGMKRVDPDAGREKNFKSKRF